MNENGVCGECLRRDFLFRNGMARAREELGTYDAAGVHKQLLLDPAAEVILSSFMTRSCVPMPNELNG